MVFVLSYVASFAALAVCFFLTGLLVEKWLLRESDLEGIRFVGRVSFGLGLWIILLFLYASLNLLTSTIIFGTLLTLAGLLLWQRHKLWQKPRLVPSPRGPSSTGEIGQNRLPESLLSLCLVVMFLALFLQALWPRVSWDANVYHLTVPRLYLENQGFWRIPFNVYSNWPLNTELLFAMAMAIRSHVLAKLVHFGLGCLTTILVYRVARESAGKWAGWAAAILFLANSVVLVEIRVAYVDLASALFFTLAFVLVHRQLESSSDSNRLLVLAGIFAGLAAGTKLTGMVGAFCLAGLLVGTLLKRRTPVREVFRSVSWLLIPAVVLLIPWLVKSWLLTGNPVYPFLFQVFGGPEWSRELQQSLTAWQQSIGMGRSPVDYLLLPVRVILDGGIGYDRFDGEISKLWIVVLPLSIWVGRRRAIVRRALEVAGIYFVFWALSSQQMRFLIPILPLLAIAGAVAIAGTIERVQFPRLRKAAVWVCTLVLVGNLAIAGREIAVRSIGMMRDYLHFGLEIEQLAEEPVYRFINNELPIDARVMMLNTNHGFFCRRDFVADSFFEASQITALMQEAGSKSDISKILRNLNVSHLLIKKGKGGASYPDSLVDFLNDTELVRSVYRSPDERFDVAQVLGIAGSGGATTD